MPVKPIESFADFQQVLNGDRTVIIDFWATWCVHSRSLSARAGS